jgi:hypothetical protein
MRSAPSHLTARLATAAAAAMTWVALAAVPATAQSTQWKWRDASGQITVSDLPPPRGIPDKDVLERPAPPSVRRPPPPAATAPPGVAAAAAPASAASAGAASAGSGRTALEAEVDARRRAAERDAAARTKAEEKRLAEQRAENCARARSQIAALESGQRIARFNEKGEREVLEDDARAQELRRAREVAAADCR